MFKPRAKLIKMKNEMKLLKEKTVESENDQEKSTKQTLACDKIIKQGKQENLELRGSLPDKLRN